MTWLIWGRGSARFDKFTRAVCNHYLKEAPGEGMAYGGILLRLGRNLTQLAADGQLTPVTGRDEEITRLCRILNQRVRHNPVITGDPGVGKTTLVEGLAIGIVAGGLGDFKGEQVIEFRAGDLAEKPPSFIRQFLNELANPNIIAYFDEFHILFTGRLAEEMKPILLRPISEGGIRLIGATTHDDLRRVAVKNPAFEERYEEVPLQELDIARTVAVLKAVQQVYTLPKGCTVSPGTLEAIAWASTEIIDHRRPRTAINILDAVATEHPRQSIEPKHVAETVSSMTGIVYPYLANQLGVPGDTTNYAAIAQHFYAGHLYVQPLEIDDTQKQERPPAAYEVAGEVFEAYFTNVRSLNDLGPVDVIGLLGPTGVGKTEWAYLMATLIYEMKYKRHLTREQVERDALLKVDMSQLSEAYTVSRLTGSAPGLVGYYESGELVAVRERPTIAVVLLDELERAHPRVLEHLMNFLVGPIKDSRGRWIDPRRVIVVATSNIPLPDDLIEYVTRRPDERNNVLKNHLARHIQSPIVGRFGDLVAFRKLTPEGAREILTRIMLPQLKVEWLDKYHHRLDDIIFTRETIEDVIRTGYSKEFGARFLRQAVNKKVVARFSRLLRSGGRVIRI